MSNDIEQVEEIVQATNAVAITDPVKLAIITDLGPIVDRMSLWKQQAAEIVVKSEETAITATTLCDEMAADIKAVKDHEVLGRITTGLHALHKRWVALRKDIADPIEATRKELRNRVLAWQDAENRRAEEEERRLQAEADARAAAERQKLLKKSETVKRDSTKERYEEEAQQVQAPTVQVARPQSGMRGRKTWTVTAFNEDQFFQALAARKELRSFVKLDRGRMIKAKANQPMLNVPGVTFKQIVM